MKNKDTKKEDFINLVKEKHEMQKPKRKRKKFDPIVLGIFIALYMIITGTSFLVLDKYGYELEKKEIHSRKEEVKKPDKYKDTVILKPKEESLTNGLIPTEEEKQISEVDKELLKLMVVQNAINYYNKVNSQYPKEPQNLLGYYPNNYLSFIPEGISYNYKLGNYYKAKSNTYEYISCDETCNDLGIELHIYEDTNQLGVIRKDTQEILALYTVATGKESLPFQETKILKRVQNPNLTNESLGTRGFELQDNFAIHGTNDPSSIGKKVSMGCVRMNNADIEILYPYMALGTPVKVKQGKPEQEPIFKEGLPKLEEGISKSPNETSPNEVFNWKF